MKELYRLLREQKFIESELKRHKAYLRQQHCPVQIGDKVIVNNGCAHEGKPMIVDRLFIYHINNDKYCFKASGYLKKKDGTPSVLRGEWSDMK